MLFSKNFRPFLIYGLQYWFFYNFFVSFYCEANSDVKDDTKRLGMLFNSTKRVVT